MPHIKLTKKTIDNLVSPKPTSEGKATQAFYRDTELTGFGLKLTSAGTKIYIVEARVQGKPKRITIGKHGALTPEQARKQAQRLIGEIAVGRNPSAEKRERLVRAVTLAAQKSSAMTSRRVEGLITQI